MSNCSQQNQMVQNQIGNAYDVVLAVYNQLAAIGSVNANADNIQDVLDNLGDIQLVGPHISHIHNVNNHIPHLHELIANLSTFDTLNANQSLYIDVAGMRLAIGEVLSISTEINRIADNITAGVYKGPKGDDGDAGAPALFQPSVATFTALPINDPTGTVRVVRDTTIAYQWDGTTWVDLGVFTKGEKGDEGIGLILSPAVANISGLPTNDVNGSLRVVQANSHIYRFDGTNWIDLGIFANGERGTSLTGRDRKLTVSDLPTGAEGSEDGDVRIVYENGHIYSYHAVSDSWTDMGQFLHQYKPWVNTVAELPTNGNSHNDVRGVNATGVLYGWDAVSLQWILLGSLKGDGEYNRMDLPVANLAALPSTDGTGTLRYVIDSGRYYVKSSTGWNDLGYQQRSYYNTAGNLLGENAIVATPSDIPTVAGANVTYNSVTKVYTVAVDRDVHWDLVDNNDGTFNAQLIDIDGNSIGTTRTIGKVQQDLTTVLIANNCLAFEAC